ncbi:ABC transporter permease [Robertmurraya korlensis]|uniref:ABC transporter permease n=1 Tax=Robertmurraya korlensis TaxID=519977 RepID=UPI00203F4A38|nr:ABC transporter permease [Robertmurraya korlensis]MCM3602284.1 ABC transporter permease [Robertmurraya korlensis]
MFDAHKLWRERLGTASKEIGRYSRYIFNGHIVIVLVFLLGTAAFYYQEWVKTLSSDFPVALLMAIILSLVVTISPIFTFVVDPDKVFLLALEERLESYFNRSILLSFFIGLYLLVLFLGVLMPIYAQVTGSGFHHFLPFLVVLAGLKLLNLYIRWRVQYYVEESTQRLDTVIRFVVNGVFLYLLFNQAAIWLIGVVAFLLLLLFFTYYIQTKKKGLKWERLIQLEERRMMSFYRLANLFTDVPKLKDEVKRRRWLDWITSSLPYQQNATFLHLFLQTFIRGGDYLGLWIRLTVIGGLVLYFVTFGYGQILFVVLFLYLTGFQLLPLWNHHQNKLWIQLYPVKEITKKISFQKLLFVVLSIQSLLLSIPIFLKGDLIISALALFAGVAFSYLFVYQYSHKKLT